MYNFVENRASQQNKLVSIGKAAKILGLSTQTLRRWDKEGKLAAQKTKGGQRRYNLDDLKILTSGQIFQTAWNWASQKNSGLPPDDFYCPNRAIFEARLQHFGQLLLEKSKDIGPLIISAAGEIGNNSFDHNLGNWPDVPGLFFAYDLDLGIVVLADRGQGILTTLQRVKPELYLHTDALETAFTEVITGRAPEKRGNGLKLVKKVIQSGAADLVFQTGNAKLIMDSGSTALNIETTSEHVRGVLAQLKFLINK
jgi:excisionase family DNA binding protein